jgi:O-antigen/teichoic acid export membrane protein
MASKDHGSEHALLSRGGRDVLVLKVAAAGSSFLMYVFLARALGVSEYGVFIYVLTWLNVILLIGKFGMELSVVRFLPAYAEKEDWRHARGILRFGHFVVGSATIALVALGLLVAYGGVFRDETVRDAFAIGLFSIPLLGFSILRQGALRAFRAFALAEIPDGLIRPWLLIAAVGLMWAIAGPVRASSVMLCYFAVNIVTLVIGTRWLLNALPPQLSAAAPVFDSRTWFVVSVQLMLHTGVFQLINQIDILLLGILTDSNSVARYSAASRLAWFTSFGVIALSSVVAPLVSTHFARSDLAGVQRVVSSGTRRGFTFAALTCLIFTVLGSFILGLFGRDFISAYPVLLILASGQLVNAFWGLGSYVMMMTGHQHQLVLTMVAALCLNAILNWVLIPRLGIIGAAAATAATTVAWSGAVFMYCLLKLRVRVSAI